MPTDIENTRRGCCLWKVDGDEYWESVYIMLNGDGDTRYSIEVGNY
ncbi:MAG: hypothetical protein HAW67_03500 [Endozoicomonadaceae bacterium]|nr:hypothetical protein [Endozoicomonadaceae bacterium]